MVKEVTNMRLHKFFLKLNSNYIKIINYIPIVQLPGKYVIKIHAINKKCNKNSADNLSCE